MITPTLEQLMMSPRVEVVEPSALERILADKRRIAEILQKYNMRDTKNERMPEMQWEGDDHS